MTKNTIILLMVLTCISCSPQEELSWGKFKGILKNEKIEKIHITPYSTHWQVDINKNRHYKVNFVNVEENKQAEQELRQLSINYTINPPSDPFSALYSLFFILIWLLWPMLIAIAIYHLMLRNRLSTQVDKIIWAATILVLPYLGPLLYLIFGRRTLPT